MVSTAAMPANNEDNGESSVAVRVVINAPNSCALENLGGEDVLIPIMKFIQSTYMGPPKQKFGDDADLRLVLLVEQVAIFGRYFKRPDRQNIARSNIHQILP